MDRSKWVSLVVAALYVIVLGFGLLPGEESEPRSSSELFKGIAAIGFWLAISLGCIWWGEELGEGLVGAKYGLVSSASPGWAVALLGWVLLLLPAVVVLYWELTSGSGDVS